MFSACSGYVLNVCQMMSKKSSYIDQVLFSITNARRLCLLIKHKQLLVILTMEDFNVSRLWSFS